MLWSWAGRQGCGQPLHPHPSGGDLKVSASVREVQTRRRYVQLPNWLVWFSLKFPGELSGLGTKQASSLSKDQANKMTRQQLVLAGPLLKSPPLLPRFPSFLPEHRVSDLQHHSCLHLTSYLASGLTGAPRLLSLPRPSPPQGPVVVGDGL